jgi:deazaflavin-dependent oxidoreductase (nitroreductase family)
MTITNEVTEVRMKKLFKLFNKFMLLIWRLGLGSYGNQTDFGGNVMVITQLGRKTGRIRRTPVNFAIIDEDIYCTSGFGRKSDWYHNIMANPEVQVWMPDGWWAGIAEDVSDTGKRIDLMRAVLIGSGFAAYLAGINPHKLSDMELDAATRPYRLIRIQRKQALTGPNGPGDLAWLWPLFTMLLLGFLIIKKRRKV